MEHQNKLNLLNEESDSKFVTRKWNILNNPSNTNYDKGNDCDYNNADILVRSDIIINARCNSTGIQRLCTTIH